MPRHALVTPADAEPRLLRRIVENIFDYVHVAAPSGEILYATPTCERVLGRCPAELIGRDAFALIHPDDVARARAGAAALVAGGPGARLTLELRVLHADGTYRWIEGAGANFVDDDAVSGLIIACIDVTDRRLAQEALLDRERRFRALIERSAEVTSICDEDGRLTYVSPSVEAILGYPPAQLLGASAWALIHDDDRARTEAHFAQLRAEPGAVLRCQHRVRGRDGEWRWMNLVATNLLADPAVAGIVINEHDVTAQHRLEVEAAHAKRFAALGRVAGSVAHDFANMLFAVAGLAELTVRRSDDPLEVRALMAELQEIHGRATALTRQLLTFSGEWVPRPAVIDVRQHLEAAAPTLARIAGGDVRLEVDAGTRPAPVVLDPAQLDQVLVNLVVNARDAMPGGGTITLRLEVQAPTRAVLVATDTGVGMPADVVERIFEPFFTTKPAGVGTGLGLATVFGVVKQAGGDISVVTAPGQGTTFELRLPLRDDGGG